jgi:aspartate/methionine/tyrosine aminotransferase
MTGWRIGWIAAHPALGQVIENMIQYSTPRASHSSCSAPP